MIDVHVPQKSEHTWADFFIHIGTIAVGLLLAIGLEQTVELVHHRHQRHELQRELQADAEKTIQDTELAERALTAQLHYILAQLSQVKASLDGRKLPDPTAPSAIMGWDVPQDPAWQAAKADGTVAVLPAENIKVFTELDASIAQVQPFSTSYMNDSLKVGAVQWKLTREGAHGIDMESLTADQKREHLDALMQLYTTVVKLRFVTRQVRGGALAVARGERDLRKVQLAEHQFDKLP